MVIPCQFARGGFVICIGWGVILILCVFGGTLEGADRFLANAGQPSSLAGDDEGPAESQADAGDSRADVHPKDGVSGRSNFEKQRIGRSHQEPAAANHEPKPKAGPVTGGAIWRTVLSLVLVLVLIVGGSYWLRRFSPRGSPFRRAGGLEIIARNHINPKQSMCLVRVGSRLLLVGLSPNHMASLDVIDDPEEISQVLGHIETDRSGSISNTFGRLFHRESRQYPPEEVDEEPMEMDSQDEERKPYLQVRGELAGLLNKVKGLRRLGGRF